MKQKPSFPQVKATFYYPNRKVSINTTPKTKRLYAKIRHGKFLKVYIKVLYGKRLTNFNRMEMFYNDGTYLTVKEALTALKSFLE
jgi:hypothetical protein